MADLDDRSRWIDLDGPVHYLDLGGAAARGLSGAVRARRGGMPPGAAGGAPPGLWCVAAARTPADVFAEHVAVARMRAQFTDAGRDFLTAARSVVSTASIFRGGSL